MNSTWRTIPVVLITGHAHVLDLAAELNVAAVLRKPFVPSELLTTLQHMLNDESFIPAPQPENSINTWCERPNFRG